MMTAVANFPRPCIDLTKLVTAKTPPGGRISSSLFN